MLPTVPAVVRPPGSYSVNHTVDKRPLDMYIGVSMSLSFSVSIPIAPATYIGNGLPMPIASTERLREDCTIAYYYAYARSTKLNFDTYCSDQLMYKDLFNRLLCIRDRYSNVSVGTYCFDP